MKNIDVLLQLLISLLGQANGITELLQRAQSEGRDVTEAELDTLAAKDDDARLRLQDAINAAKGQ